MEALDPSVGEPVREPPKLARRPLPLDEPPLPRLEEEPPPPPLGRVSELRPPVGGIESCAALIRLDDDVTDGPLSVIVFGPVDD